LTRPWNNCCCRYEDGTLPFSSVAAVEAGLRRINAIGMPEIEQHTASLRSYLAHALVGLKHHNGSPAAVVYGPAPGTKLPVEDTDDRGRSRRHPPLFPFNTPNVLTTAPHPRLPGAKSGSICAFNMLGADGRLVPYSHVEELASVEGISVRTGAFCNPGAVQEYLGASSEDVAGFIAGGKVHITYTLHPAPCTLHHTPCTLHPAPCTLHYTLYTYTLHPTPYIITPPPPPISRTSKHQTSKHHDEIL
jgi:selenocysteine lyase/cysteine desulfurase